jgi:hypothetical protein
VVALKQAYRARQITRAEYNTHARALKVWRKQAIHQAKVDYKQKRIDRAGYDRRVDAINRAYKGG